MYTYFLHNTCMYMRIMYIIYCAQSMYYLYMHIHVHVHTCMLVLTCTYLHVHVYVTILEKTRHFPQNEYVQCIRVKPMILSTFCENFLSMNPVPL